MKVQKRASRAKRKLAKKLPLLPVYSGPKSKEFWARVAALSEKERHTMYSCGVLLQNMEESVLGWLQQAEAQAEASK